MRRPLHDSPWLAPIDALVWLQRLIESGAHWLWRLQLPGKAAPRPEPTPALPSCRPTSRPAAPVPVPPARQSAEPTASQSIADTVASPPLLRPLQTRLPPPFPEAQAESLLPFPMPPLSLRVLPIWKGETTAVYRRHALGDRIWVDLLQTSAATPCVARQNAVSEYSESL